MRNPPRKSRLGCGPRTIRGGQSSSDGLHWNAGPEPVKRLARLGRARGSQGEPHVRHVGAASAACRVIDRMPRRALERVRVQSATTPPRRASSARSTASARAYGLPRLRTSRGLARAADAHSATMRRTNTLGHGDLLQPRPPLRPHAARSARTSPGWRAATRSAIVQHVAELARRTARSCSRGRSGASASAAAARAKCFVTADFATAR